MHTERTADTPVRSYDSLPLFGTDCDRCQNIGIRISPGGSFETCPAIQVGAPHPEPNPAGTVLRHFAGVLQRRGITPNSHAFDVARMLVRYTSTAPCPRDLLLETHFAWTKNRLRKFHHCVEELRSLWLLPVGSRKEEPSGYWIITEVDDFSAWVERAKSAPITQLSTIHRVARANFPIYAEQLELEFWGDIAGPDVEQPPLDACDEAVAPI